MSQTKTPPCDQVQERIVISDIVLGGNPSLAVVRDIGVCPEDFFNDAHRILYRGILALDDQGKPYDAANLYGWVRQQQFSGRVPSSLLGEILGSTPAKLNVAHSALVLRKLGALREVIGRLHAGLVDGYGPPGDLRPYFDGLVGDLGEIVNRAYPASLSSCISAITADVIRELHDPPTEIARTHLPDLDRLLGPLHSGYNLVMAARPGMGKTSLALQIALHEASAGHGVIIASLEQPKGEVVKKLIYNHGKIDNAMFRTGLPDVNDWNRLHTAAQHIESLPIRIIDDVSDVGMWRMRFLKEARELEREGYPVTLGITDYLQLMSGKGGSREEVIADASRRSKALAKEIGMAHIAISQLNRGVESREDKHPMLSDLRESGSIEQDADAVVFIYRHSYYTGSGDPHTENVVAKNRHGGVGVACTHFDGPSGRFSPIIS